MSDGTSDQWHVEQGEGFHVVNSEGRRIATFDLLAEAVQAATNFNHSQWLVNTWSPEAAEAQLLDELRRRDEQ